MRGPNRSLWLAAAALAALALIRAAPARAEADVPGTNLSYEWFGATDPERDIHLCILLPYPRCRHALDAAIGYGGGVERGTQLQPGEASDYMQFYVDAAYLARVVEWPSLQVGPAVGWDIEIYDESRRYSLYATARARVWAGRWITFDLDLGVVGGFDDAWAPLEVGGIGELAITLHGHLGAYVQTEVLDGPHGLETRVTGGFRGSVVAWALIFAGMGG
jgi:hypothetical protein